jgi:hypothetical protein
MVGEEGRAQVTRGTGRQRKRQTQTTLGLFFSPWRLWAPAHLLKTISDLMQVSDVILNSIFYFSFRSHRHPPPLLVKEVLQS